VGNWKPEPCKHEKQGIAGGCEECFNEHQELTAVASTKEGLERAARFIEEGAVEAFRQGNDKWAKCLRELRDALNEEASKEGQKQDALLEALKDG
jgi:hypothetical protein